jgi:hypothetical protein
MFVPVACSQCGKPFQVPEAAVGKPAACPWCQAAVLALPVGAPVVAPAPTEEPPRENRSLTPPAHQEQPEPLPLDDEPPARVTPPARVRKPPPARVAPPPPRKLWWWLAGVAGVFALVLATTATVAYLRYKQGYMTGMEWKPFTAPDGSCSLDLLGQPTEDTAVGSGERRYVSEGWYSGTVAWVGWRDLNQTQVQLAGTKDAWDQLAKVFDAERDRLKEKYGGTVSKDDTIKFEDPLTREVRLATPQGSAVVERMIVMHKGSRPRIYFVGMAGRFDPGGDAVKRLFDSFRVSE